MSQLALHSHLSESVLLRAQECASWNAFRPASGRRGNVVQAGMALLVVTASLTLVARQGAITIWTAAFPTLIGRPGLPVAMSTGTTVLLPTRPWLSTMYA